jgi:hypothetical protein
VSKHKPQGYADADIGLLQQRIYLHRLSLRLGVHELQDAVRDRIASPAVLAGAVATGFALERLTRRSHRAQARGRVKKQPSLLSTALRAAIKFAQSGPGMWLAAHVAARRAQQQQTQPVAYDSQAHVL